MGPVRWMLLGLIAGSLAGVLTGRRPGNGCLARIVVGVVGALVGGALARAAGFEGIDGFGLRSILVATVGAAAFLLLLTAVEGRRRP